MPCEGCLRQRWHPLVGSLVAGKVGAATEEVPLAGGIGMASRPLTLGPLLFPFPSLFLSLIALLSLLSPPLIAQAGPRLSVEAVLWWAGAEPSES
jgi:hypothetical protein